MQLDAMVSRCSGASVSGSGSRDSSNKDLLQLEKTVLPLEKRLLECTNDETGMKSRSLKHREAPAIGPIPESTVLGRIKRFLPTIDKANSKLFSDIQERGGDEFNVELVAESADRFVEMDLALGVADLYTPEAVAAAQLAANGQTQQACHAEDNLEDTSSESDEDVANDSHGRESSSKRLVEILRSPRELNLDIEQKGTKLRKIEQL